MVELDPEVDTSHWRRGSPISTPATSQRPGSSSRGYHSYDQVDRENGIWALSLATEGARPGEGPRRAAQVREGRSGTVSGRLSPVRGNDRTEGDHRNGSTNPKSSSPDEREKRLFYAELYIGLNEAVEDETSRRSAFSNGPSSTLGRRTPAMDRTTRRQVARLNISSNSSGAAVPAAEKAGAVDRAASPDGLQARRESSRPPRTWANTSQSVLQRDRPWRSARFWSSVGAWRSESSFASWDSWQPALGDAAAYRLAIAAMELNAAPRPNPPVANRTGGGPRLAVDGPGRCHRSRHVPGDRGGERRGALPQESWEVTSDFPGGLAGRTLPRAAVRLPQVRGRAGDRLLRESTSASDLQRAAEAGSCDSALPRYLPAGIAVEWIDFRKSAVGRSNILSVEQQVGVAAGDVQPRPEPSAAVEPLRLPCCTARTRWKTSGGRRAACR